MEGGRPGHGEWEDSPKSPFSRDSTMLDMLFWPEIAVMPAWYIMHVLWVSYNTRASRSTSLPFLTSFFVTLCATVAGAYNSPNLPAMILIFMNSPYHFNHASFVESIFSHE